MESLIPCIVDQVLFELLNAVDTGELALAWQHQDGSFVPLDELGLGEMAGWLMGSKDSWRSRFSAEGFHDPLSGFRLE